MYATDSAGWFWTQFKAYDLNMLADKNDLIAITAIINGGFNHYNNDKHGGNQNRLSYLMRAFDSLRVDNCKNINDEIRDKLRTFDFVNSVVYDDMVAECFGWGLWHDPNLNKLGCKKSISDMRSGYSRFLELSKNKSFIKKRYGYTFSQAVAFAKTRV